ncbi:5,6-dihydroxyindole-2-carboxylic acid oxidase-like [Styela clava]
MLSQNQIAFTVLVLVCIAGKCQSQFPRACATMEAYLLHECCPVMRGGGSQCGEAEGRGMCADIVVDEQPWGGPYTLFGIDDRERWPERFFNRSCQCFGNFGGYDCAKCKPGWKGQNCDEERPLAVRRDIAQMPLDDAVRFLEALDQAKTTIHPDYVVARDHYRNLLGENGTSDPNYIDITIYDLFVWVHYYSVRDTLLGPGQAFTGIDFSHEGPAFLTWHRMHLLNLEEDLREMTGDEDMAIPYWNFAIGGSECDICTDELVGDRHPNIPSQLSPNSRFADWEIVCLSLDWFDDNIKLCNGTSEGPIIRNPGGNTDRPLVQKLPEPEDVAKCLGVENYDTFPFFSDSDKSFRNTLEGYAEVDGQFAEGARTLHNLAHLFLNGTGGQTHASANDPIFVLLHAFTDAIFEEWLIREQPSATAYPTRDAPIGHNIDYNMVPFFPPVTNRDMFVEASKLGYKYEFNILADLEQNSGPSFIWAVIGVIVFAAFVTIVTIMITGIRRRMKLQQEEELYQRLIAEDYERDEHYGP